MSIIQAYGSYWLTRSSYLGLTLIAFFVFGCSEVNPRQLSQEEQQTVLTEIHERMEWYGEAVTSKDIDAMLTFWSDSQDFTFAGDGAILGSYEDWAPMTTQHIAETKQFLYWNWRNMNVVALARDAASVTTEFEYRKISIQGDTLRAGGAWTYVFKKYDGVWEVIQTNGTHLEL